MSARVLVVGGVGQIGRHVVRLLATLPEVKTVIVGDIATERAELLASELGERGEARAFDATDRVQLDEALADVDLVVNTMGPFDRFGLPILTAAIENGRNYVDVCDDWQATESFLALDEKARAANVTAVIGFGLSPGITNMLAIRAARGFSNVDRMLTGWSLTAVTTEHEDAFDAGRVGSAATYHWIEQVTGTIRVWRDGGLADVTPLDVIEVDYPGRGKQRVYALGHPEPITLPTRIGMVRESLNVMSGPQFVFDQLVETAARVDSGEFSVDEAVAAMSTNKRHADGTTPSDKFPKVWAHVTGIRDGKQTTVAAHLLSLPPHRMGGNTGYPAALTAAALLRGDVQTAGVLAPEDIGTPEAFFESLRAVSTNPGASLDEFLIVTEVVEG